MYVSTNDQAACASFIDCLCFNVSNLNKIAFDRVVNQINRGWRED